MRRWAAVGGVGVRRTLAVLGLVVSLALMALGLMADLRAAMFTLAGAAVAGLVAVVDVDKLMSGE